MSPWLHRAMEGPTTSSAIFYGALSIHLGPFLLLRTAPLWSAHPGLRLLIGSIGAISALYGAIIGRTRCDAKTTLAYATIAQVGVIYIELALGLQSLAIVHLFAHSGLRTWQFLRSSSLIQDFQENPLFSENIRIGKSASLESFFPAALSRKLYVHAMNGFYLDALLQRFIKDPFLGVFERIIRLENAGNRFAHSDSSSKTREDHP